MVKFVRKLMNAACLSLALLGMVWTQLATADLHAGMTTDEVRKLLGPPERIARQILHRRYQEMWTYEHPAALYVEFSAAAGQAPRLVTVHPAFAVQK